MLDERIRPLAKPSAASFFPFSLQLSLFLFLLLARRLSSSPRSFPNHCLSLCQRELGPPIWQQEACSPANALASRAEREGKEKEERVGRGGEGCSGNERGRVRRIERERAGGSVRERAALSDAAQFAKSTSSTLTRRQSSGERAFSCTNRRRTQPASISTMAAIRVASLTPPPPSLSPSLCLHNATLAEDGKEGTPSFRIPPDPTAGSCSWVYHSKQRGRNKPGQPHSSDCTRRNQFRGRMQKWLQNVRGGRGGGGSRQR